MHLLEPSIGRGRASGPNLLGPHGDRIVHGTRLDAAPVAGYRLERLEGGDVTKLFGAPISGRAAR
jgi:hypothetical protein